MEDRETARMGKYGESKMTRIMMATVLHVTSGLGLRKFQADGFLLTRVYIQWVHAMGSHIVYKSVFQIQYNFVNNMWSHSVHSLNVPVLCFVFGLMMAQWAETRPQILIVNIDNQHMLCLLTD